MFYSEIKRETLGHINQYSIAGSPIAASYNNQADYLNQLPILVNEGIMNIRTLVKPEPAVFALVEGEEYGGMMRYTLPDDFWSLKSGGVSVIRAGQFHKTNNYRLMGKKFILVPKDADGQFSVEYYRYPNKLPTDNTLTDTFELVEDPEVIQAATYYAAANLVMYDDEHAYACLYNDYESRLGRISPGITVEVQPVDDAYGFNDWGCGG